MRRGLAGLFMACLCGVGAAADAQPGAAAPLALTTVTRADAIAAALQAGIPAALARADTMLARAQLLQARALPNPTLATSYSQSAPQLHATVDVPFDVPWLRRFRVAGAEANLLAATLRFAYTRASVRYDVEVAYGVALVAAERQSLSGRAAKDADSLRTLALLQRSAGAASDLEVELATINADQQANATMADTLAATGALLDLQMLMGIMADVPRIALADSLPVLLEDVTTAAGPTEPSRVIAAPASSVVAPPQAPPGVLLSIAAAQASLQSQDLALRLARRRSAIVPSLQVGVEGRDPTGGPRGPLPIVGLSIPLPIFNRYRGDVAFAEASLQRASAELLGARRTATAFSARAQRELAVARRRLARDERLVSLARIVAAKAVTAYAAGATPLSDVLQAQRAARDAFAQYVADAITATTAAAAVRLASATATP